MQVSVKGSQKGGWGLTQGLLKNRDYHKAIDDWTAKHALGRSTEIVFCLVQFKETALDELPRIYLATTSEIAKVLRGVARGTGSTMLYEYHRWTKRANASGTTEEVPDNWRFSQARPMELLNAVN